MATEAVSGQTQSTALLNSADGKFYYLETANGSSGAMYVVCIGAGIDYSDVVSVSAGSSIECAAQRKDRRQIHLTNDLDVAGAGKVYVGTAATVTATGATKGTPLVPGDTWTLESGAAFYAICEAGKTATLLVRECT